jgi:hypothetical protein
LGITTISWDEVGGGWWMETVRVPQPLRVPTTKLGAPETCEATPLTYTDYLNIGPFHSDNGCSNVMPASNLTGNAKASKPVGRAYYDDGCSNVMPVSTATDNSKAGKLTGTWVRELEGTVIAITLVGEELKISFHQIEDDSTLHATVLADYTLTKDGLVYGVITGVDVDLKRDQKTPESSQEGVYSNALMSTFIQSLVDCPLSFRARLTSSGLMISNLKIATEGLDYGVNTKEWLPLVCGMFKLAKDGNPPLPKKPKMSAAPVETGSAPPVLAYPPRCLATCGAPGYSTTSGPCPLKSTSSDHPDVPARCYPAPGPNCAAASPQADVIVRVHETRTGTFLVGGGDLAVPITEKASGMPLNPTNVSPIHLAPPVPANVPPATFDTLAETFGQMLNAKQTLAPPVAAPPACILSPIPACSGLPVSGVVLPPCAAAIPAARSGIIGTWVRVVGPVVYVIHITPDHLTVTVTVAREVQEGEVVMESLILMGDYHLMPDGKSLVGIITCFDARLDGVIGSYEDYDQSLDCLSQIQKAVTEKPFALSVRLQDDGLLIGNVRLPEVETADVWSRINFMGGRYAATGEKPLPKPRVTKAVQGPLGVPLSTADYNPNYGSPVILGGPTGLPILPAPGFPQVAPAPSTQSSIKIGAVRPLVLQNPVRGPVSTPPPSMGGTISGCGGVVPPPLGPVQPGYCYPANTTMPPPAINYPPMKQPTPPGAVVPPTPGEG